MLSCVIFTQKRGFNDACYLQENTNLQAAICMSRDGRSANEKEEQHATDTSSY